MVEVTFEASFVIGLYFRYLLCGFAKEEWCAVRYFFGIMAAATWMMNGIIIVSFHAAFSTRERCRRFSSSLDEMMVGRHEMPLASEGIFRFAVYQPGRLVFVGCRRVTAFRLADVAAIFFFSFFLFICRVACSRRPRLVLVFTPDPALRRFAGLPGRLVVGIFHPRRH